MTSKAPAPLTHELLARKGQAAPASWRQAAHESGLVEWANRTTAKSPSDSQGPGSNSAAQGGAAESGKRLRWTGLTLVLSAVAGAVGFFLILRPENIQSASVAPGQGPAVAAVARESRNQPPVAGQSPGAAISDPGDLRVASGPDLPAATVQPAIKFAAEPSYASPVRATARGANETPAPEHKTESAALTPTQNPAAAAPPAATVPAPEIAPAPVRGGVPADIRRGAVAPKSQPPAAMRYTIQLASLKSRTAANREWTRLSSRFGDMLGTFEAVIRRADLAKRGIFYRLRAGAFANFRAAQAVCRAIRAKRQPCIVVRR